MKKKTIAFGPERDVPSWNWVGFDAQREIAKYYKVATYTSMRTAPQADIVVVVKQLPDDGFIVSARKNKSKIIYCPIDFFNSREHLIDCGNTLKKMDAIVSHCERLNPLLRPFNNRVFYADHNNKFALPEMSSYKKNGYILWVGGCQYTAYLIQWLQKHPLKHEIKILTDIENGRACQAADNLANEMGLNVRIQVNSNNINGIETHKWSERLQYEMMCECKAAIDIKGDDDFNQKHKPATKAQKYIASGLPFAINEDSYSHEYFLNRGFKVCSPTDTRRWFSEDYWEETRIAGTKLRKETSIESVGKKFSEIIERL